MSDSLDETNANPRWALAISRLAKPRYLTILVKQLRVLTYAMYSTG
jgi:hypothetical protein